MKSVSSRRRQQRKQQTPGDVESDESESDPDQLISSRTESSNQLDAGKLKHSAFHNLNFLTIFCLLNSFVSINSCFSSRGFGLYLSRYVEHIFGHFSHVRTEVTATKGAIKVMIPIIIIAFLENFILLQSKSILVLCHIFQVHFFFI